MIPTVDDLESSPMTHRFGDLFNPPGLTNFLGCVQTEGHDPVAIRSFAFPPFAMGDAVTAGLFINGKFFPAWGAPVTTVWRPDRIERTAEVDGLHLFSTTVLAVGKMAAVVRLAIQNRSGAARKVTLKLGLRGGVTKSVTAWNNAVPPTEDDNLIEVDSSRKALRFTAKKSSAVLIQGTHPLADEVSAVGLRHSFQLNASETKTISFIACIGDSAAGAERLFDDSFRSTNEVVERATADWNEELLAIFTPGNSRYSGHLPLLETTDRDILKVYHTGAVGIAYFKRDTPFSVHGRAYGTLLPRYWHTVTFLWDYSLSSMVHALLDPAVMKANLQRWMKLDIHKHFGTEFLTGAGVGPWYSVNDFAMSVIARDYLRFNGDFGLLDQTVGEQKVRDYLSKYAHNWKQFRSPHGLADYGGLNNLLECVNTYLHEVASLNGANVFNLRFAAELAQMNGDTEAARNLIAEAVELGARVNELYVNGKGYFNARFPDTSVREVRHIYDFITVLNTMHDLLPASQQNEMADFFARELMTPTWAHALSPDDDDSMFSVRPDHQWNGAYPAWPPQAVTGLYKIGKVDLAFDWLKGLAKSANQGPYGQAHFCESVVAPEAGGAIKAPSDFPYINDWTCSSVGAWCNTIIESIFGVRAGLQTIEASPQFGEFDPKAVLRNLRWQGKQYTVTRAGLSS
ncbi:MAG TPA: hypothetical protein PLD59_05940 [Tepidisphaeraceae bacterium]|nr:hypothetical protein [Tepidisphaeraceae bacterium]